MGQAEVHAANDEPADFQGAVRGQQNGLCGAAEPGRLLLLTGLHTGHVGFRLEVHGAAPALEPAWEEAVEVSFQAPPADAGELGLYEMMTGDLVCHIPLTPSADYRARYYARDMARGKEADTILEDEDATDFYCLMFWPALPSPDAVLKQTSEQAAYWHEHARGLRPLSPQ